jgi:hypothetical protein
MSANITRRGALCALASAPALALLAADPANALWAERQTHVERLALASAKYDAAKAQLPVQMMGQSDRIGVSSVSRAVVLRPRRG